MRDVVLYIATSLDGFIARADGSIDWLDAYAGGDFGYEGFLAGVDTLLVGGVTYRQMLTFEEWPYADKRMIVFTRSEPAVADPRVEFVLEDPAGFVRQLKTGAGSRIWLVGGAGVISVLADAGLIDEIIVSTIPLLLRAGIPLAWPGPADRDATADVPLGLVSSVALERGVVQSTYRVVR
jgi:dihydrofolate reductase